MAKQREALPNLENATPGYLVDELGRIREETSRLKRLDEYIKAALYARLAEGQTVVVGEVKSALIETITQIRLDNDKVKEDMGADWWADHCKEITFKQIRITNRGQSEKADDA